MNDSLTTNQREIKSTRLDDAHDLLTNGEASSSKESWMAMAGKDPNATTAQLDRQTNELIAYVQQQNDEIDSRQSELNAKLAQLDNELRRARLTSLDEGDDLSVAPVRSAPSTTLPLPESATPREAATSNNSASAEGGFESTAFREFDEVERIVAEIAQHSEIDPHSGVAELEEDTSTPDPVLGPSSQSTMDDNPFDLNLGLGPTTHLRSNGSGADIDAMASSLDASAVESEKRLLAERKIELDRRKAVLHRMQDETQALHREALEMRLVTEQLWARLSEQSPGDHLNELLTSLRARLDSHYATTKNTLLDRKNELMVLKNCIHEKQAELREQSHKLQDWVESRHEEIKSYAAQLDAREMLLDRREHRLQDEFSKWEAQRRGYKQQLQGLLQKLSLAGLNELGG